MPFEITSFAIASNEKELLHCISWNYVGGDFRRDVFDLIKDFDLPEGIKMKFQISKSFDGDFFCLTATCLNPGLTLKIEVDVMSHRNKSWTYHTKTSSKNDHSFDLTINNLRNCHLLTLVIRASNFIDSEELEELEDLDHILSEMSPISDCTIRCQDQIYQVHKIMLVLKSPVFRRMFQDNGMKESKSGILEIKDFDSAIVKKMLAYCYHSKLEESLDQNEIINLLRIANKYDIQSLSAASMINLMKVSDKDYILKEVISGSLQGVSQELTKWALCFAKLGLGKLRNPDKFQFVKKNNDFD